MGIKRQNIYERFSKFYTVNPNGCWNWNGNKDKDGYGFFWVAEKKQSVRAHRWAYEYYISKIEEGMTIDHLCRVKNCVRPEHLEVVTNQENTRRRDADKTHCLHGHVYNEENVSTNNQGSRYCKICRNRAVKKYTDKLKEAKK